MTQNQTKTLHTPVFFPGSNPASSLNSLATSSVTSASTTAYLDALSRTHVALAQIVPEVPDSREGSPIDSERVEDLKEQVLQAYDLAGGDPADSKWSAISRLLTLTCTKGRARWIGTRNDIKPRDHSMSGDDDEEEFFLADTEEQWFEWERKREKKREGKEKLIKKVETWKRGVNSPKAESSKAKSPKRSTSGTTTATLTFPVVKRSSLNLSRPPKPPQTTQAIADVDDPVRILSLNHSTLN